MKTAGLFLLAAAAAGAVAYLVVRRRARVRNVERDANTGATHF